MYEHETFPNAPITEALIDLQVKMDDEFSLDRLKPIIEELQNSFPQRKDKSVHRQEIKIADGGNVNEMRSRTEQVGSVLHSEDQTEAVQIRVNGFTYSKLKPYESWDVFRDRARDLWQEYREIVKPVEVVRVATRFINRIELPKEDIVDFDDFFSTGIRIADGLPQGMTEFLFRIVVPSNDDRELYAIVMSTFEQTELDDPILPYIFDIDVFKHGNFDPYSDEIWSVLKNMRDYKNEIFFLSMTDKARDLFR
jgi:uncharacterized protein (TIGR04255 family)